MQSKTYYRTETKSYSEVCSVLIDSTESGKQVQATLSFHSETADKTITPAPSICSKLRGRDGAHLTAFSPHYSCEAG